MVKGLVWRSWLEHIEAIAGREFVPPAPGMAMG